MRKAVVSARGVAAERLGDLPASTPIHVRRPAARAPEARELHPDLRALDHRAELQPSPSSAASGAFAASAWTTGSRSNVRSSSEDRSGGHARARDGDGLGEAEAARLDGDPGGRRPGLRGRRCGTGDGVGAARARGRRRTRTRASPVAARTVARRVARRGMPPMVTPRQASEPMRARPPPGPGVRPSRRRLVAGACALSPRPSHHHRAGRRARAGRLGRQPGRRCSRRAPPDGRGRLLAWSSPTPDGQWRLTLRAADGTVSQPDVAPFAQAPRPAIGSVLDGDVQAARRRLRPRRRRVRAGPRHVGRAPGPPPVHRRRGDAGRRQLRPLRRRPHGGPAAASSPTGARAARCG
jgi:hypothetical protein